MASETEWLYGIWSGTETEKQWAVAGTGFQNPISPPFFPKMSVELIKSQALDKAEDSNLMLQNCAVRASWA